MTPRTRASSSPAPPSLDRVMAQAAHDLQEPLRLVSGYLDLLVAHLDDHVPLDPSKLAHEARDAADRMQLLVAGVLDAARATTIDRHVEPVPLADVVRDAERNLQLRLADSHAVLHVGALPTLRGDRAQLSRIFQNLIENSVKYAVPGRTPEIWVWGEITTRAIVLRVDDNGPGWPEGRERAFEPFVRLHADVPGSGLGLSTVRTLVAQMGGTVRALDAPTAGARVEMRFPRSAGGSS